MWQRYLQPRALGPALALLREHGAQARIVAGGTDVLVELQRGIKPAATLIDVTALDGLRYVRDRGDRIELGGLATHNDILASAACAERALPLVQACLEVGAPQIRTRATIAGNLVTASPANDTIVPLLAMGCELVLASADGERLVDLADFFTGFRATVLRPDELVREIRVRALWPAERGVFLKLGLRRAQAISVISVAAVVERDTQTGAVRSARIALGCVAPTVVRAPRAEAVLAGRILDARAIDEAAAAAAEDAAPIGDVRGSAAYRRTMVRTLVARALHQVATGTAAQAAAGAHVLLDTGEEEHAAVEPFRDTILTTINGTPAELRQSSHKTLLDALRDEAGLTGSKEGCGEGECGACTVWLDGKAVMSCLVPAAQAHGLRVRTIEGLGEDGELHPLQQAYIDCGAVQCGFCIPGMLMAGAKLLEECSRPTLEQHQAAISGNLCRCTGYRKILDAMLQAGAARETAGAPV